MFKKRSTSELLGVTTQNEAKKEKIKKQKKSKEPFSIAKFFKNRVALAGTCLVFAFVVSFIVIPIIGKYSSKSVEVVRLIKDVSIGEKITQDKIEMASVGGLNIANDVIKVTADAIGKYASVDMLTGDVLQEKKLSGEMPSDYRYLMDIPEGKLFMSIKLNGLAEGLSGKLRAGDIVRVFATTQNAENDSVAISPENLQYVEVIAVTNQKTDDIKNGKTEGAESEEKQIETVTLCTSQVQATTLAALENVHLALVYRGDEETRTAMIQAQDKYVPETEVK